MMDFRIPLVPRKAVSWLLFITYAFQFAVEATIIPADPSKDILWPYYTFESVDFTPPVLNITQYADPSEGYLFFAPDGATPFQIAPLIMDASGELIWNGPLEHAFNFGVYDYNGADVLAWWNGTLFPEPIGRGNGVVYIYNNQYELINTVTLPGNFLELEPGVTYPSNIDLHEIQVTSTGSMLVTANNVTQADLTSVGGPSNGWVVAGLVYEIDIATNEVLFSWNSLDHLDQLPFTDSLYPLGSEGFNGKNQSLAWGYFHINSVTEYGSGYLISSRYFCSAIAIDASDGSVVWRLSGRTGGDFQLAGSDEVTGFCYQHGEFSSFCLPSHLICNEALSNIHASQSRYQSPLHHPHNNNNIHARQPQLAHRKRHSPLNRQSPHHRLQQQRSIARSTPPQRLRSSLLNSTRELPTSPKRQHLHRPRLDPNNGRILRRRRYTDNHPIRGC